MTIRDLKAASFQVRFKLLDRLGSQAVSSQILVRPVRPEAKSMARAAVVEFQPIREARRMSAPQVPKQVQFFA